jgi:curved DNA-binding protein CbpA
VYKDYYKTLEIHPSASAIEVKQAYRALARKFHPDKNTKDPKATEYFQEIQSAYEVLSNPLRRRAYDTELKQKGFFNTFSKENSHSSEEILKQSKSLYQYIRTMEKRAINSDALADYVIALLNKENISLLQRANDGDMHLQIADNLLNASKTIISSRLFAQISEPLLQLFPDENAPMAEKIKEELAIRVKKENQNNRVPIAALVIVILIVLLMYLILHFN